MKLLLIHILLIKTCLSTVAPTLSGREVILLYSDNQLYDGLLGDQTQRDARCTTMASSLSISNCNNNFFWGVNQNIPSTSPTAVTSVTKFLNGISSLYGFSGTLEVYSTSGIKLLNQYSDIALETNSFLASLNNVVSVPFWSGTKISSTVQYGYTIYLWSYSVCGTNWNTNAFNSYGGLGNPNPTSGSVTSFNSVFSTQQNCIFSAAIVCGCVTTGSTNSPVTQAPTQYPTLSPTKNPTSPTALPTLSPTTRPTKYPTQSPTLRPTKPTFLPTNLPTKRPTLDPTEPTSSPTIPTRSPSKSPTSPTSNPTKTTATPSPTTLPTNDPTQQPTSMPLTTGDVNLFEQLLSCRLPFGLNPVLSGFGSGRLLCAGQGMVHINQSQVTYYLTTYEKDQFPLFTVIFLNSIPYNLTNSTSSIYAMQYLRADGGGGDILNIIDQEVLSLNGELMINEGNDQYSLNGDVYNLVGRNDVLITLDAESYFINGERKRLKVINKFTGIFLPIQGR